MAPKSVNVLKQTVFTLIRNDLVLLDMKFSVFVKQTMLTFIRNDVVATASYEVLSFCS